MRLKHSVLNVPSLFCVSNVTKLFIATKSSRNTTVKLWQIVPTVSKIVWVAVLFWIRKVLRLIKAQCQTGRSISLNLGTKLFLKFKLSFRKLLNFYKRKGKKLFIKWLWNLKNKCLSMKTFWNPKELLLRVQRKNGTVLWTELARWSFNQSIMLRRKAKRH